MKRLARISAASLPGSVSAPLPEFIEPQLASFSEKAPEGKGWLNEVKFDGYRIISRLQSGTVQLFSRHA